MHQAACDLWPAFLRAGDHRGRFLRDLAAATGKRVIVVNYPPEAHIARAIDDQGFRHRRPRTPGAKYPTCSNGRA